MNTSKPHITGINFERAILASGIIVFHYFCHSSAEKNFLYSINDFRTGQIITTCFFMLSGAMLYYNHQTISSLPNFYLKRFKSIYPSYWIAYLTDYILKAIILRTFFWTDAKKWKLILSVIGIDGYLLAYFEDKNFYILGEWFLGVLIFLYLIYPLLLKLLNNYFIISTFVICSVYLIDGFMGSPIYLNFFKYIAFFYTGMLIFKFKKYLFDSKPAIIVSILTVLLLSAYTKPTKFYLYFFFSAALFIALQKIGSIVESNKIGQRVSDFVGGISYEIFLIQHIVILQFLYRNDPVDKEKVFLNIVAIIIVCIIIAKILKLVSGKAVYFCEKKLLPLIKKI